MKMEQNIYLKGMSRIQSIFGEFMPKMGISSFCVPNQLSGAQKKRRPEDSERRSIRLIMAPNGYTIFSAVKQYDASLLSRLL